MTKTTGNIILGILFILSFPAVGYAIYDFYSILESIRNTTTPVLFDSGTYYLSLMSVFWAFGIILLMHWLGYQERIKKYANQFVIIWFVACLGVANAAPYYLENKLQKAGYVECSDAGSTTRVSRGKSTVYVKGTCGE